MNDNSNEERKVLQENVDHQNEKLKANAAAGSAKKKNKKKGPSEDEQIQNLLKGKMNELAGAAKAPVEEDKNFKRSKRNLKHLSKFRPDNFYPELSFAEKVAKLKDAMDTLASYGAHAEQMNILMTNKIPIFRKDKENSFSEYNKHSQLKASLETACRDAQKKNAMIAEANKKFIEEEGKKRHDLIATLDKQVNETREKVDNQKAEADRFHEENEKIKELLKQKIKDSETREQNFMELVKQKDAAQEEKHTSMLTKLKSIEGDALEVSRIRKETEAAQKRQQEITMKTALFGQKLMEYESTYSSSLEMLKRFRHEFEKTASRVKALDAENKTLHKKNDNITEITVNTIQQIEDYKSKIQKITAQKEKIHAKVTQLNGELKNLKASANPTA